MPLVSPQAFVLGLSAIGAAVVMFSTIGIGIGQGITAAKAVEGVSRQPEATNDIIKTMLLGQAVTETTGIFAFIVAIVLLFANPFANMF